MLFSFDDEYLLKDYFNLTKTRDEILSPKEGLILGNMFSDEYKPYKNYRPSEIKINSEKERELLKIRELSFAVNDLNLKLDLEPNNDKLYKLFKMYAGELEMCISKYNKKYNPLEVCDDIKDNYTWYKGPWPWEGMNV